MKLLKDILYRVRIEQVVGSTNTAIEVIAFDSRKVVSFTAFVAVRGTQVDGHAFIEKAIESGASAIICETIPAELKEGITYVRVEDAAATLGIMAANFFDHPSKQLKLVGITGTNGKTSTATLLFRLFRALGYKCGLVSTVETRIGQRTIPSTHTTPDAIRLNELLAEMVEERVAFCFMEVSSHSVVQERIAGLQFAGGVFMNITHDHLDYHGTFAEYIKAKKRFFDQLPATAFALVNADDANSAVMLQNTKATKRSFAVKSMADHRARIIENQLTGLHLNIDEYDMYSRLIGEFNASNLLATYTVATLLGEVPLNVLTALSDLEPPRGRFQVVRSNGGVIGVVDYAHTPDALKNVLTTINDVCGENEQVITVLGCGGDRDRTKRPIMARIATDLSSHVVLTSDNPRTEDPMAILEEMRQGVQLTDQGRVWSNADRKEAIRQAVGMAKSGDVVLVAGKGHETYQEISGMKHPFDDVAVLKETLELLHK
ncbi:MAG TPA: UDP-N-acetylmuramoyl-L-alanyl-D-glutamate--2,6-diaminopimelate ligase [Flavobacteriales bacterium]|jgi:UDP-N-acetylmuramoyl-L-alanyl-D-glutamate--2,6-diaminopimelate ligase|nr:UDP-N-acetylmuramoyl-L-alanyl-D-glutamate--2,6-diaminopimelate ligase [Flavobacteriales bacterium]MBK6549930.1 UDP-N-acetylmuramoyl-L-alanyl-D-glutamate--2,6-diaminopimelate ligase [Flavobacteriales bacterium]MBK7102441.1 UDP-N-acetylmuramoyl-L-alanyl-D-glutamate--2,6-diaminopimelate ligase [Flavobacteriales bacterium]MBK7113181.1 UDP-N-acetylmuramoyl-L-alanyl-D-glutamate--2,6-diaminopimelate ligase [Flavobacteriales bacterium]MBK7482820.1 UDP-N-acetylmuramoyl-L-alanyl-D-glutamate--2,6-diami